VISTAAPAAVAITSVADGSIAPIRAAASVAFGSGVGLTLVAFAVPPRIPGHHLNWKWIFVGLAFPIDISSHAGGRRAQFARG